MDIQYELTWADYEHLQWRLIRDRRKTLLPLMVVIFLLFALLGLFGLHLRIEYALVLAACLMAVFIPVYYLLIRVCVKSTFKTLQRSPSWGKTTVRPEPESLLAATYLIKSELRWEAVTKIGDDTKGFYFYLNPLQVIMVPRRVFASLEEAQMFWSVAQEYYQHARKTPAALAA